MSETRSYPKFFADGGSPAPGEFEAAEEELDRFDWDEHPLEIEKRERDLEDDYRMYAAIPIADKGK